jgi:acetyl esterase/lipase
MRLAAVGFGFLSVAFAVTVAVAQDPQIKTENDVVYAHHGEQDLKLDITEPAEGDGPFPAVLVIHGGAWRAGNKRDSQQVMATFAKKGYVAVSPQYRFCPKEPFPAQVIDVKAAVRWVREHAPQHKVDSDHIGAMGFSAGGHLSLMLGVTDPKDGLEGEISDKAPSSRVQAVVNYFGPSDLGASDFPEITKPLIRDFLGGAPKEKPEETKKASPITFVTKDDPPILTFQGTRDPLVPHSQATKLADALTSAGVPGRVELIVGGGHGDWGRVEIDRTLADTIGFFDKHLKKAK